MTQNPAEMIAELLRKLETIQKQDDFLTENHRDDITDEYETTPLERDIARMREEYGPRPSWTDGLFDDRESPLERDLAEMYREYGRPATLDDEYPPEEDGTSGDVIANLPAVDGQIDAHPTRLFGMLDDSPSDVAEAALGEWDNEFTEELHESIFTRIRDLFRNRRERKRQIEEARQQTERVLARILGRAQAMERNPSPHMILNAALQYGISPVLLKTVLEAWKELYGEETLSSTGRADRRNFLRFLKKAIEMVGGPEKASRRRWPEMSKIYTPRIVHDYLVGKRNAAERAVRRAAKLAGTTPEKVVKAAVGAQGRGGGRRGTSGTVPSGGQTVTQPSATGQQSGSRAPGVNLTPDQLQAILALLASQSNRQVP